MNINIRKKYRRYRYNLFLIKQALNFGIKAPFEVPSPNFMTIKLEENKLKDVSGKAVYAKEFFENS